MTNGNIVGISYIILQLIETTADDSVGSSIKCKWRKAL